MNNIDIQARSLASNIKTKQIKSTNTPLNGQIPSANTDNTFTWVDNGGAWTDLKREKQLVKDIDKIIGDLIDDNSENFEQLYDLMDDLAKHEYLKNNKHFIKVKNKVDELHEVHQEIAENRDVKLVHEERIEKYLNDVQEFFDKFVDDYAKDVKPW